MKKNTSEPRLAVIGGGTGLSTLLRGLKKYTANLTAIVTVSDDGGSSGALRRELGVLPPGDIRNCLVALSEEESLMTQLFKYRFPEGGSLSSHSFGNLFLAAMSALSGSFGVGVARAGEVLAIRGRVLPVTLSPVTLKAKLNDGKIIHGETNISKSNSKIKELKISPNLPPAGPNVIDAILSADAIIIGPGSLYTSLIANLLVKGIVPALRRSPASKIYVCNVMTQPGESSKYSLSDHLDAIEKLTGPDLINYMIVNTGRIPNSISLRYARQGSYPVRIYDIRYSSAKLVKANLISRSEYARHDPQKLAKTIFRILGFLQ